MAAIAMQKTDPGDDPAADSEANANPDVNSRPFPMPIPMPIPMILTITKYHENLKRDRLLSLLFYGKNLFFLGNQDDSKIIK